MTTFGIALVWCAVQVTLVAVFAAAVYLAAHRVAPAARALTIQTSLLVCAVLAALALSPWPRWWSAPTEPTLAAQSVVASPASHDPTVENVPSTPAALRADRPSVRADVEAAGQAPADDSSNVASIFWDSFRDKLRRAPTPQPSNRWDWPQLLAASFLVGLGLALLRVVLGLRAVGLYRRLSTPISDRRISEMVDVVCAELSCRRTLQVRESAELATPATTGWRHPVIFLPVEWRNWSDAQCRTVLAHEIAHIDRNDFLTSLCARVGVAVHFYHPLVHWLMSRLTLEQELAADAAAARVAGGQRNYLTILAEMALAQSNRPIRWPARTFLPTRGTFLRRIEMLRDSQHLSRSVSPWLRAAAIGIVLIGGVLAAGFRPPGEKEDKTAAAEQSKGAEAAEPQAELRARSRTNLKRIGLAMHNYHDAHGHFPPPSIREPGRKAAHSWRIALLPYLATVRFRDDPHAPTDRKALEQQYLSLYEKYNKDEPWDSEVNKQVLAEMPDVFRHPGDTSKESFSSYYVVTGKGTVFDTTQRVKIRDIADGTTNTLMVVEAKRNIPWTKPEDIPYDSDADPPQFGGLDDAGYHVVTCDGQARFLTPESLNNDQLKYLIERADGHPVNIASAKVPVITFAQKTNPREAASRDKARINLKRIGLAMHNYHDVHNRFPKAIEMGPDGKTPHSWRVAILPYVEEPELHAEYKFDEPWDSENNKKVLAKMPSVFRHVNEKSKEPNSSYYVFVGKGSMFEENKEFRIRDVKDGTTTTWLAVEAKRDIPWTKPEDIPYDPEKDPPTFGGFDKDGYNVLFVDGSVRFFKKDTLDKTTIKRLIEKRDGHVIILPGD